MTKNEEETESIRNAALAYRFEYHIFHAGEVHRIGRIDCRDIYSMIGEWMKGCLKDHTPTEIMASPIFLFMDGNLWTVLEAISVSQEYPQSEGAPVTGKAVCTETSIPMGVVHRAIVEQDPRVIEW